MTTKAVTPVRRSVRGPYREGVKPRLQRRGDGALGLVAALLGLATTLAVTALRQLHPVDLLALELLVSAVALLGVAAAGRRLSTHGALRAAFWGAVNPGLAFLLADVGLARTSAISGSLLLGAEPLAVTLLAVVLLRERLSRRALGALALGIIGTAVLSAGAAPTGNSVTGNLLVLGAVVATAGYIVATRSRSGENTDQLNATAWQSLGATIAVAPYVLLSWAHDGTGLHHADVRTLLAAGGGALCTTVALLMLNSGLQYVPASRAGQILALTPLFGVATAALLLTERPSVAQVAGGAVTLIAVAVLLTGTESPAAPRP